MDRHVHPTGQPNNELGEQMQAVLKGEDRQAMIARARRDPFFARAYFKALIALVPLLCLYVVTNLFITEPPILHTVSAIGQIYFSVVLVLLAYVQARNVPEFIWTPAFWLPLQSAIFFGLGPLVRILGNEVTQAALNHGISETSAAELLRANLLSVCGVWFLLFGMSIHFLTWQRKWNQLAKSRSGGQRVVLRPAVVAGLFLVFGGILKYGVALPAAWGMFNIVVPGTLSALLPILDVGFAVAAYMAVRGHAGMRIVLFLFLPAHVFLSLLTFSKLQVVMALLLPALGSFIAHRNFRRLAVWVTILMLVFASYQPIVAHGRAQIYASTGTIGGAGYLQRASILLGYPGYSVHRGVQLETQKQQGWWTRLDYTGQQAHAMGYRDAGVSAPASLKDAWLYFIPRALWPDKPILTGPGLAFYQLVTQSDRKNFYGLSIYGDLYWQFGWLGDTLGCIIIGLLFASLTRRSLRIIKQRDFVRLPLVLIALQMSLTGPNQFITNGIIGPLPIYFGYLLLLALITQGLRSAAGRRNPVNRVGQA